MLRRKTIIVLTITFMVTLMVSAFSYLYISQVLRLRLDNANETATQLTRQLAYAAENDPPDFSSTAIDTNAADNLMFMISSWFLKTAGKLNLARHVTAGR